MWVWSKLSGSKWEDAWEDRFYGNPNAVISQVKAHKTIRVEVYTETEQEALEIQKQFGGSVRKLVHKNWAAHKQPKRKPIRIRSEIIISNEESKKARQQLEREFPGRHIIQIPAEMAFGTGDHATTSTCLRLLVDIAKERKSASWSMLDLGTGSGVIAIAAKMLGAQECLGMDFDPQAVKVSKGNVKRNLVDKVDMKECDVLKWHPDRKWPVVVANMFSSILQQAFPTIVESMTSDADLIVSGILYDQWEETEECAKREGLIFQKVIRRGKWVSARGKLGT